MKTLKPKDKAPQFGLKDQNGHNVGLSDFFRQEIVSLFGMSS